MPKRKKYRRLKIVRKFLIRKIPCISEIMPILANQMTQKSNTDRLDDIFYDIFYDIWDIEYP